MAIPFRPRQRTDDGNIFGRLGAVALTDILHMLGVNQRTATVFLSRTGKTGEIFFRDGILLHASVGSARGDEALMRLVAWKDADFVVEEGVPADTPSTISKSVDSVLLDVLTRLDEGFVPNVTPFPGLDRPTAEEIDSAARLSRLKPPPPRKRLAWWKPIAATAVAALAGAAYLGWAAVQIGSPPAAVFPNAAENAVARPVGMAGASVAGAALDPWALLGSEGVARDAASPPPAVAVVPPSTREPAEASPQRVDAEGYVLIVAEPWAEVAIDGRDVGETPLAEIALGPGPHEIVLSNPNVVGVIRDSVVVRADETLRRSYSFTVTGRLRIVVRPWADVYVDGRHVGQTPLDEMSLPLGTHEVVLRHPTLGEKSASVSVSAGETALVEVEM